MIYLFGWLSIYVALVMGRLNRSAGDFFSYVSIFFLTAIAFSRGAVGTDTANYEALVGDARVLDIFSIGMEPGFLGVVRSLGYFIDSDPLVVRLLALIYGLGILLFFKVSEKSERFLILAFILPTFFFSYSMNALRIGMASVFLVFSAHYLLRGLLVRFYFFSLFAIFFHYSTVFSILFLMVFSVEGSGWRRYLHYLLLLALLGLILYAGGSVLDEKSATYSDYQAPDALSGLSQVLMLTMLFLGILFSRLTFKVKIKLLLAGVLFTAMFWAIARQSYAGLRFLDLLVFVYPLSFIIAISKQGLKLSYFGKACFVLAGLLSIIAQYRGFLAFEGIGATPFLPYLTYWN